MQCKMPGRFAKARLPIHPLVPEKNERWRYAVKKIQRFFQEGSMKLTSDDTGLFGLVAKAFINVFAASDTVKQATIDKCAAISLANSADIKNLFAHQGGFINWYNATLSATAPFKHRGRISTSNVVSARFDTFWDQIPRIFSTPTTSAIEFSALMCVGIQENSGDLSNNPEAVGRPPQFPHLIYAFEAIPHLKSSYNVNTDLGNLTALKLFQDAGYVAQHSALAGFHRVVDQGINQAWGTKIWPNGFPNDEDAAINGFVMQADFYKFRGRGVIQTTGRDDYKIVINFILNNAATIGRPVLDQLKATWDAFPSTAANKLEVIASRSTNAQWDQAFSEPSVLAAAVAEDSKAKRNYLVLSRNEAELNGGTSTPKSLFFMARKINGGDYPDTVVPMMKAMMRAIAAL
jgi:hypothetical protein